MQVRETIASSTFSCRVQPMETKKARQPDGCALDPSNRKDQELLDLGFLELDMLAHDGVILGLGHLVRKRTAVLRGDIERACVSRRKKLDLDRGRFRHGRPAFKKSTPWNLLGHGEIWPETTH
jgi:hypothetical protein